jgi:uncharacterized protein (TIGR02186 family)
MTATRFAALCALTFAAFGASQSAARADTLVADVSTNLVAITSSFTGTELILFGAVERDPVEPGASPGGLANRGDVVVILRGPPEPMVVRQKERTAGIWINRHSVEFERVPSFYFVASTRPLEEIADASDLLRYQIGAKYLRMVPKSWEDAGASRMPDALEALTGNLNAFREAVVRNKERAGLYDEVVGGVQFTIGNLFRATLTIPANVPVGNYDAEVYLLQEGEITSHQSSTIFIDKTGFERWVYRLAQNSPLVYGIGAVLIALFAGWFASVAFRSD